MFVVLLNGPPYSGKNAAGKILEQELGGVIFKAATPLKEVVHVLFGSSAQEVDEKGLKEKPAIISDADEEITWRELYISLAEDWAKKKIGQGFFGSILARAICQRQAKLSIVTDCGFVQEINKLMSNLPRGTKILLVRCHRPGRSFMNDSRNFLGSLALSKTDNISLTECDLSNKGSLDEWQNRVCQKVKDWMICFDNISLQREPVNMEEKVKWVIAQGFPIQILTLFSIVWDYVNSFEENIQRYQKSPSANQEMQNIELEVS